MVMDRCLTGNEVRYILRRERVNLRWLSDKLGISPQSLNSRLNATEFRHSYLIEINNVLGRDVFGINTPVPTGVDSLPILDIRVGDNVGNPLEYEGNKVIEQVSIPSLTGCIGVAMFGDGMTPRYQAGDILFVRPADAIDYGHAYVIITKSDRMVRNIYPADDDEHIRLVCLNAQYPDNEIKRAEVLHLYKVVGCLHREQM